MKRLVFDDENQVIYRGLLFAEKLAILKDEVKLNYELRLTNTFKPSFISTGHKQYTEAADGHL